MCVSLLQVGIAFEQSLDTKGKQYTIHFCDETVKNERNTSKWNNQETMWVTPPPHPKGWLACNLTKHLGFGAASVWQLSLTPRVWQSPGCLAPPPPPPPPPRPQWLADDFLCGCLQTETAMLAMLAIFKQIENQQDCLFEIRQVNIAISSDTYHRHLNN